MLFLTHETNLYNLLHKYLLSNNLIDEGFSLDVFNQGLIKRGQELGFKNIEDYCSYVLILPYQQMLAEIKSVITYCVPLKIYQHKAQLDSLTSTMMSELATHQKRDNEQKDSSTDWLRKVLTTEIRLKSGPLMMNLNLLALENAEGEEAYSAAIRLKSILSEKFNISISAMDSNQSFISSAKEGVFHMGKIMGLLDNYRALYFEKETNNKFKVTGSIKNIIRHVYYDPLTDPQLSEDNLEHFNVIMCNNLVRFYPMIHVHQIIRNMIPYLQQGGLLLIDFNSPSDYIKFQGLDLIETGKTTFYRRNEKEVSAEDNRCLTLVDDSIHNRLFIIKALFINGVYTDALKEVRKILADNIDNVEANFIQGDILAMNGEYQKALESYDKTIFIDPSFLPARFNLSIMKYLTDDSQGALEDIDKVIANLDSLDYKMLQDKFNVSYGTFVEQCRAVKDVITAKEPLSIEKTLSEITRHYKDVMKAPDIEIPDIFDKPVKPAAKEEPVNKDEEGEEKSETEPTEKKVVMISELPSSRDYGEHDPWKKKLLEKEKKKKEEEMKKAKEEADRKAALLASEPGTELELAPIPEQQVQPPQAAADTIKFGDTPLPVEPSALPPTILEPGKAALPGKELPPTSLELQEKAQVKEPEPIRQVERRTSSRLQQPARALFLDNISPEDLGLKVNKTGGLEASTHHEPPTPTGKVEKADESSTDLPNDHNRQLDDINMPVRFSQSLDRLLKEEDPDGILRLLDSFIPTTLGSQRKTLQSIKKLCNLFMQKSSPEQDGMNVKPKKPGKAKPDQLTGPALEISIEIKKLQKLLDEMNLLEASMQFQKILNLRSSLDSHTPMQKKRLFKLKKVLQHKITRYEDFIEKHFTDPFDMFQSQLWEALSMLTPPASLITTGKRYGLDPEKMPDRLKR